jgi:hypothetical protein
VFLRFLLIAVFLAIPGLGKTSGLVLAKVNVFSEIDLSSRIKGKKEAVVDAGQGLVLRLTAPPEGRLFGEKLLLKADGRQIAEIKGGRFEECLGVKKNSTNYWIVSEYSGGAHCCGVYHFLAQPGPHKPITYLGKSKGHNGGPLPLRKCLVERGGALFFTDLDNRFDYFHESHAGSMLVNLPDRYYQLSPTGIKVNNLPFKAEYLKQADATQQEIQREVKKRRARPQAILGKGFGAGFANLNFSDQLGQLLVRRTLYLLYARGDQKAWQSFSRDVGRYYGSTQYLSQLKADIEKKLQRYPY